MDKTLVCAFTRIEEGSADNAGDEDPTPSLGVDVQLPTPEQGDNYIHASVMLPLGNSTAWGKVIACKRNANGNPIGRANENLRLIRVSHGI